MMPYDFHQPEAILRSIMISQDAFCEEFVVFNREDNIDKVLGYSTLPLYRNFVVENTIDTLIVDALKWKVNADVVLSNGFRFCPPRVPGKDGKVAITEGYLYDMLPVDSTIRTAKATGQQIMNWLEKEIKKVDWSIELTNPLEEYSFIKRRNKDLILF